MSNFNRMSIAFNNAPVARGFLASVVNQLMSVGRECFPTAARIRVRFICWRDRHSEFPTINDIRQADLLYCGSDNRWATKLLKSVMQDNNHDSSSFEVELVDISVE